MTVDLVDHLVYATPDLNHGIDDIERLLGVRPAIGGRHVGRAEHPDATSVLRQLQCLGIELPVSPARRRALIATIDCPRGRVELR